MSNFNFIFSWLFIFSIVYGFLEFAHPFGDNKHGLNSIIGFSLATMLLFSTRAINMISFMAPWFVICIIVVFFMIFLEMILGLEITDIKKVVTESHYGRTITYWIISIAVIILIFGFSLEFGQDIGPYLDEEEQVENEGSSSSSGGYETTVGNKTVKVSSTSTGSFKDNLGATIFHPKVLGLIAIIMVATFSIRLITYRPR